MTKLYLEDLAVGQKYLSGEYMLTEDKIKQFASEYDPQPFHLDEQSALSHPVFQGLAGSGWQTAAITMRLRGGELSCSRWFGRFWWGGVVETSDASK